MKKTKQKACVTNNKYILSKSEKNKKQKCNNFNLQKVGFVVQFSLKKITNTHPD